MAPENGVDAERLVPLTVAELVDDRALDSVDDDAFRLNDFVDELVALTDLVRTPANIALFAAWGSGKTSLANLLGARLKDHPRIAFARFDAFKYAGEALRRHFISQLAFAFKVRKKRYHRGLYSDEKRNQIEPARGDLVRLGLTLVSVVCVVAGAAAAVAAFVAALSGLPFVAEFKHLLRVAAPGVVIASGLLGTLVAFLTQGLTVESTVYAPSSEEQFERLFRALVADVRRRKRRERLVILIDELDRCAAGDVVTVLETLKTFLEIRHCVFIVSADRRAIEHAIAQESRQATPLETANPYYSAGSAYLDKIFQYQLALPPLLPKTLSQFALDLVESKPGVWQRVPNKAELVTVLVPAHVRSPRRVKVLLNAFALSFRVALERAAAGALDPNVGDRASELAKLVCLRTEFPLFAADLHLDARLTELTLTLSSSVDERLTFDQIKMPGLSEDTFDRARAYADGRLPLDEILATPEVPTRIALRSAEVEEGVEVNLDLANDTDMSVERRTVVKKQARQLLDYLQRTQQIPGPGRDMIFLESSGAAFGLLAEVAEQLELLAVDGLADEATDLIGDLDAEEQKRAYLLLASLLVERIGLEATNATHCLLQTLSVAKGQLDDIADVLLAKLATSSERQSLDDSDLIGAFRLAVTRRTTQARELRQHVLTRSAAQTDDALGLEILRSLSWLEPDERTAAGPVLASRLANGEPAKVLDAVEPVAEDALRALFTANESLFVERVLAAGSAPEAPDAATEEPQEEVLDAHAALRDRLKELAELALNGRRSIGLEALRMLLDLDEKEARDIVQMLLPKAAPIDDPTLALQVLRQARRRRLPLWPAWLERLDADVVASLDGWEEEIGVFVPALLRARFADNAPTPQQVVEAVEALARFLSASAVLDGAGIKEAFESVATEPVTTDALIDSRQALYELVVELGKARLLPPETAAALIANDLAKTLQSPVQTITADVQAIAGLMVEGIVLVASTASSDERDALSAAAASSPWLIGLPRGAFDLAAAATKQGHGEPTPSPLDPEGVAELFGLGDVADPVIQLWADAYAPGPDELLVVISEMSAKKEIGEELRETLRRSWSAWANDERLEYLGLAGVRIVHGEGGIGLLAVDTTLIEGRDVARVLVDLFDEASNNDERERVMEIWALLNPQQDVARRTLIDGIYVPLINQGRRASSIALKYFELVENPPTAAARDRIKAAYRQSPLSDEANKRMRTAGWVGRGWRRKGKDAT